MSLATVSCHVWSLVKKPLHYRCGFDIIFPWHVETNETGAQITFKGYCKGLVIKEWGLCVMTNEDAEGEEWRPRIDLDLQVLEVKENNNGNVFEPKIQLPYNWLVSNKDEVETVEAKGKETYLFNIGLYL
ncbi:unnamed protein product [Vicia faba]|uniref:Uncharacterized protein n=1 Tax=Vicia faba TaxID=3906 RepID=A0AAV1AR08_VICFA|nr:unnamed protein product [Vicia faba]